jgi:hypothetical protein
MNGTRRKIADSVRIVSDLWRKWLDATAWFVEQITMVEISRWAVENRLTGIMHQNTEPQYKQKL